MHKLAIGLIMGAMVMLPVSAFARTYSRAHHTSRTSHVRHMKRAKHSTIIRVHKQKFRK